MSQPPTYANTSCQLPNPGEASTCHPPNTTNSISQPESICQASNPDNTSQQHMPTSLQLTPAIPPPQPTAPANPPTRPTPTQPPTPPKMISQPPRPIQPALHSSQQQLPPFQPTTAATLNQPTSQASSTASHQPAATAQPAGASRSSQQEQPASQQQPTPASQQEQPAGAASSIPTASDNYNRNKSGLTSHLAPPSQLLLLYYSRNHLASNEIKSRSIYKGEFTSPSKKLERRTQREYRAPVLDVARRSPLPFSGGRCSARTRTYTRPWGLRMHGGRLEGFRMRNCILNCVSVLTCEWDKQTGKQMNQV
nr:predicted GPI-anchored protein 58 [Penaeus vannamei]